MFGDLTLARALYLPFAVLALEVASTLMYSLLPVEEVSGVRRQHAVALVLQEVVRLDLDTLVTRWVLAHSLFVE